MSSLLSMVSLPVTLCFTVFFLCFGPSLCGKIVSSKNAVLVWNCADENLKSVTELVMQRYANTDDISEFMTNYLRTYRGGGWAVLSVNYVRITANITPEQYADRDVNICYVSTPDQKLVTILAKIN